MATTCFYLFTAGQIHQVEFATEFLLCLSVLLLDVNQEDAVTPRAVLIHVYRKTKTWPLGQKHNGHYNSSLIKKKKSARG